MSPPCAECAGSTVWDDAAASEICTSCGRLTDASQVILTNQDYRSEPSTHHELRNPAAPNILKTRSNYTLAGQGQALRDQKNALTMSNFIRSLAVSVGAPGQAPRATTLFSQAKAINYFRWGTRARTVAGACLSIALRESNRPDSIHDISTLLRCSPQLLSRTFISLASALKITTLTVDPSVYIGTLQGYLTIILQEHQVESGLPPSLLSSFRDLSIRAVANTALSLGRILSRSCPPSDSRSRPSAASTACAIFMLSLEAEQRNTLDSLADLAKCLGGRCHIGKGLVMSQYKVVQDQVANLIEKVPWLDKYEQKGGRAKVSKRLVVARGLKDVIRFNEEILQNVLLPELYLELSDEDKDEDPMLGDEPENDSGSGVNEDHQPTKRRKVHHTLDEASRFLLNPFNTPKNPSSTIQRSSVLPKSAISKFPLTSYVLSTSSLSSISDKPATRLQLLATARGGSDEDAILDDELFGEGELEGFIRSDEEVTLMRRILNMDSDNEDSTLSRRTSQAMTHAEKGKKGGRHRGKPKPKKSRVNLEAFARLMQGLDEDGNGDGESQLGPDEAALSLLGLDDTIGPDEDEPMEHIFEEDGDDREGTDCDHPNSTTGTATGTPTEDEGEETVLDTWRPASPSGGTAFEDRYEEDPG